MIWMPIFLPISLVSLTKSWTLDCDNSLWHDGGIWIFGQIADRFGRKPSFILFQFGAVISIVVYSQLTNPVAMLASGAFLGMFVNGMMGGYGALMARAYPTQARATAQNVLFNFGRAVGGFWSYCCWYFSVCLFFSLAIGFFF